MATDVINGDRVYKGTVTLAGTVNLPTGAGAAVVDANIPSGAGIDADKVYHRHAVSYQQADGADVASTSGDGVPIHIARTAGTVKNVQVACADAPTGGDKAFTVNLAVANTSQTATSILSGAVSVSTSVSDYEVVTGTISSATLAAGDVLLAQVTASGSTGTQGQGVVMTVTVDEAPV